MLSACRSAVHCRPSSLVGWTGCAAELVRKVSICRCVLRHRPSRALILCSRFQYWLINFMNHWHSICLYDADRQPGSSKTECLLHECEQELLCPVSTYRLHLVLSSNPWTGQSGTARLAP